MKSTTIGLPPHQIRPLISCPVQISRQFFPIITTKLPYNKSLSNRIKSQEIHQSKTQEDGIPYEDVKTIAKFKSRHNYIRVLEVSRKADHPFAGSRLLLLDGPGNIHSISFLFKTLTNTYFDVFATLPPILPPGPLGIFGFGAGSAARIILELYPNGVIHGWELDPSVISVGREYFGLLKLEKQYPDRLFVYIGDALMANLKDGFSGILVDLFCDGSLLPELQDPNVWKKMKTLLRKDGRIMVNVGGRCVEAEDSRRDGKLVMEESLKAMQIVFGEKLHVLSLGNRKDDSSIALTGDLPDLDVWKKAVPRSLKGYVDMWTAFNEYAQAFIEMNQSSEDVMKRTWMLDGNCRQQVAAVSVKLLQLCYWWDGLRKTFLDQKDCIDEESLNYPKTRPFRSLRTSKLSPPPPPKLNSNSYYMVSPPPN